MLIILRKSTKHANFWLGVQDPLFEGIFSDFNNFFLWYESEDINKKSLVPKFQLIIILRFPVMHDYVYFIAPIDYCVEIKSRVRDFSVKIALISY